MRYLGLDVGRKKVGIASGEILAAELTTLSAPKDDNFYSEKGSEFAHEEILRLFKQEQADAIVVGLPVSESGDPTEESKLIQNFCKGLSEKLSITIHFVDETLTSFMAEDMLESQGAGQEEVRRREHQLAAQLILQQFLENNANI